MVQKGVGVQKGGGTCARQPGWSSHHHSDTDAVDYLGHLSIGSTGDDGAVMTVGKKPELRLNNLLEIPIL